MSNPYIIIPVRIEGKYLNASKQVTSPLADFARLPWNNGEEDLHFDQPFVGDGIIHEPFGDQNLMLGAGVHLHFIVPHYLGQQVPKKTGLSNARELPAAPNRWLITRTGGGATVQWIIESDYIHPESYIPKEPTCIIPYNQGRPYRYMGRKKSLNDPRPEGDSFKSLGGKPLTIIGYGDVNFSSFYPNCLGVFGFYDKDGKENGATYSILGWNEDEEDDVLKNTIAKILVNKADATIKERNTELKQLFNLEIDPDGHTQTAAPRTLFYIEITVDSANPDNVTGSDKLEIALGNTGTEALSALMGNTLGTTTEDKATIEEQLEAVLIHPKPDPLLTDTGPKFLKALQQYLRDIDAELPEDYSELLK